MSSQHHIDPIWYWYRIGHAVIGRMKQIIVLTCFGLLCRLRRNIFCAYRASS